MNTMNTMNDLLKVTPGLVRNTKHIERVRDLTIDDVDVKEETIPKWWDHSKEWSLYLMINLTGSALEEVVAIWGDPEEAKKSYNLNRCSTPSEASRSIVVKVAFQGCRSDETRARKKQAAREECIARFSDEKVGMIEEGIKIIQDAFDRLIVTMNEEYRRQSFRAMTGNAEGWIDKEAGVIPMQEELKELEAKAKALRWEIKRARNSHILDALEKDDWKIKADDGETYTLVGEVVEKLTETYSRAEAFGTGLFPY